MTPSALTPAARGSTKKPDREQGSRSAAPKRPVDGHRSELRRQVAPRAPRRVSGPARGTASPQAAPAQRATVRTRPQTGRTAPRPSAPRRPAAARQPWPARSVAYVRALPDHVLLDRIIRGRGWIPLLGVLLAGIVFMQVEVLKLNAGIGRSLERGTALQSQNELLRANVTRLADEQRIERIAARMGMVMPTPEQVKFLATGPAVNAKALNSIHTPDATSFTAQLPALGTNTLGTGATTVSAATAGTTGIATATGTPTSTSTITPTGTAAVTPSAGDTTSGAGAGTPTQSTAAPTQSTAAPTQSTAAPTGTSAAGAPGTSGSTPTAPVSTSPTQSSGAGTQSGGAGSGGVGATPVGG
jgi:cell division protein FtsL